METTSQKPKRFVRCNSCGRYWTSRPPLDTVLDCPECEGRCRDDDEWCTFGRPARTEEEQKKFDEEWERWRLWTAKSCEKTGTAVGEICAAEIARLKAVGGFLGNGENPK